MDPDELLAGDNSNAFLQAVRGYETMNNRVELLKPDCEYLAALEAANGYVVFLGGVGIVTADFVTSFTDAVDKNVRAAMTMTAEARQTKLVMDNDQYVYSILPNDKAVPDALAPLDTTVLPKSNNTSEDGPWTPATVITTMVDADEDARPRYDRGDNLYEGLTEMGVWITRNGHRRNDLLSLDRWRSFARFVAGTSSATLLLATSSAIIVAGIDIIPWQVQVALIGIGALWIRRSARQVTAGRARNMATDVGAFAVAGGAIGTVTATSRFKDFVTALQTALRRPTGDTYMAAGRRLRERIAHAAGGEEAVHNDRLFRGAQEGDAGVRNVMNEDYSRWFLGLLLANRQAIAAALVAGNLYYYFGYHHANRYVPNRQRYYLAINSASVFERRWKQQTDVLKDITLSLQKLKRKVGQIRPGRDPVKKLQRDRAETVISDFEDTRDTIQLRLNAIKAARAAIVIGDDLEQACVSVEALTKRYLVEAETTIPDFKKSVDAVVNPPTADEGGEGEGEGGDDDDDGAGVGVVRRPVVVNATGAAKGSAVDEAFAKLGM